MRWDEKFREAYRELGPSKLADEIGVDRDTVWRWEKGATKPRQMTQKRTLPIFKRIVSRRDAAE